MEKRRKGGKVLNSHEFNLYSPCSIYHVGGRTQILLDVLDVLKVWKLLRVGMTETEADIE